jgi:Cytochrome P450
MEPYVQAFVEQLLSRASHAKDGTYTVDVLDPLFSFTLDYITAFLFGESVGSLSDIQSQSAEDLELTDAFNTSMAYLAKRGRLQEYYWMIGGSKFKRACRLVHNYVDELIAKAIRLKSIHEDEPKKNMVFLDGALQNFQDRKVVRNQLLSILLAGRDTTAGFLGWLLFILARHQDVLQKLRSEVTGRLEKGKMARAPTFEDLHEMKYLSYVLNESKSQMMILFSSCGVNSCSSTVVPFGSIKRPYCTPQNNFTCWRGTRRKSTNPNPEKHKGWFQCLCSTSASRPIRRRCKRISAGKVAGTWWRRLCMEIPAF